MTLNPLAFPKGVKYECELCHQIAYLKCTLCNVTYYCCKEHQLADWEAVHETICQRLIILRKPLPAILSKEEHEKRDASILAEKLSIIKFTLVRARKFLHRKKEMLAIPAAMQALGFSTEIYGLDSTELVPLPSAREANIGRGHLIEAAEYLAQASWRMLKADQRPAALRSQLYRSLGLLDMAKGDFAEALRNFAEDVYQATLGWGPDDVHTCGGYFYMAEVFLRQNKRLVADSLYRQVTETWFARTKCLFDYQTRPPPVPLGVGPGIPDNSEPDVPPLDEVMQSEAVMTLTAIYMLRRRQVCCSPLDKLLVCLALAMVYFIIGGHKHQAQEFGRKAYALSKYVPDHQYSKLAVHCVDIFDHAK